MSGTDIAIALALGANFVLIGREGVDRIIELLTSELETACTLLGASVPSSASPRVTTADKRAGCTNLAYIIWDGLLKHARIGVHDERADELAEEQGELLEEHDVSRLGRHIKRLYDWADETETGDRDDLDQGVPDLAWRQSRSHQPSRRAA